MANGEQLSSFQVATRCRSRVSMFHQHGDVVAAVAEWRDVEREHREAIIQVLTKAARAYLGLQVAVGCCDDTNVNRVRLDGANPGHFTLLQHAEKALLQGQAHFAHFIEKERASRRRLDHSHAITHRPGEGAPHMTEQLTLEQGITQGAAVDRLKRGRRSR